MSRQRLMALGGLLAVVGLAALATLWLTRPTTLTLAVGPAGSEMAKVASALAQAMAREKSSVRLRVVINDSPADSMRKLEQGEVDLSIIRADARLPQEAMAVAIWQRNPLVLVAPADEGIARWTDLADKTIGVLGRGLGFNTRLVDTMLREHGVDPRSVRTVELLPWEVAEGFKQHRIDAVLAVGPVTARPIVDSIASVVREAKDGNVVFVAAREAEAIGERVPYLESFDVVAGSFGSNPPRPSEAIPTLSVSHFLVARRSIADGVIGELTQQIFALRPQIASQNPAALRIEPPETDRTSSVSVHPGASAYLTGSQKGVLEQYSEIIYIGIFLASILGSGAAAMAGMFGWGRKPAPRSVLPDIIQLLRWARAAEDSHVLDEVARRADDIFIEMIESHRGASMDDAQFTSVTLALEHLRAAISDRRRALAMMEEEDEAPIDKMAELTPALAASRG